VRGERRASESFAARTANAFLAAGEAAAHAELKESSGRDTFQASPVQGEKQKGGAGEG
jgi:hypothetical protein